MLRSAQERSTGPCPSHSEAFAARVGPKLGAWLDMTRVQRLLLLAVRSTDPRRNGGYEGQGLASYCCG